MIALTYLGATAIVPNYNLAGISKAALESIVRYLAYDLGDRGIRVNAISAGPISTASSRQVKASRACSTVAEGAPLHRNVTPADIGNAAVYLASDLSSAVTGDVHFVDAGYHAWACSANRRRRESRRHAGPAPEELAAIVAVLAWGASPNRRGRRSPRWRAFGRSEDSYRRLREHKRAWAARR